MSHITDLFDRMDAWRHLPSYQLERRADLFFALYLPQALEAKLGYPIASEVIPEFPVRIGTINPQSQSNRSFKIDYLALSADGAHAVFVELKTDIESRRPEQDAYLLAARKVGLDALLAGVVAVFNAAKGQAKKKYCCLLVRLSALGLLVLPPELSAMMDRSSPRGATALARQIRVTSLVEDCTIIYVQPIGDGPNVISFDEFGSVVQQQDDPVSQRFSRSLSEWARVEAGRRGDVVVSQESA